MTRKKLWFIIVLVCVCVFDYVNLWEVALMVLCDCICLFVSVIEFMCVC